MKTGKLWTICMMAVMVIFGAIRVQANGLEDYTESDNGDGTYSYFFTECGVKVTMPEEFYQNTRVLGELATATFVHKDSYDAYLEKGFKQGGRLFTIGCVVDGDSIVELPGYTFLGFDEEECINWYVSVPTDYTGYIQDEEIREEFGSLNKMKDKVIDTIEIKGVTK